VSRSDHALLARTVTMISYTADDDTPQHNDRWPSAHRRLQWHNETHAVQCILDRAREVAAEGGHGAVKMRRVAAAAGVSLGTVYRWFPCKTNLLLSVLERELAENSSALFATHNGSADPRQRLRDAVTNLMSAVERHELLSEAMARAVVCADASAADQVNRITNYIAEEIATAMVGVENGCCREHFAHLVVDVAVAKLIAWLNGRLGLGALEGQLKVALELLLEGLTDDHVTDGRPATTSDELHDGARRMG
jgi:AcrR family transcriptional regulator